MKDFKILNAEPMTTVEGLFTPYNATGEDVYLSTPEYVDMDDDGVQWVADEYTQIPRRKAVVVDGKAVGIHSDRYGIVQHELLAETAQGLIDTYPELVEGVTTAFTKNGGQKAVVGLNLRGDFDADGSGRIDTLFNLANDHGGGAAKGLLTNKRWFCMNQYTAMIVYGKAAFSIRHTANAEAFFASAAEALFMAAAETHEIRKAVETLCMTSHTDYQFDRLTRDLFGERPDEDKAAARRRYNERKSLLFDRWLDDPNRGTAWGAIMAVQGYEQHDRPTRGRTVPADRHLNDLFFGQTPLTNKVRDLLVAS